MASAPLLLCCFAPSASLADGQPLKAATQNCLAPSCVPTCRQGHGLHHIHFCITSHPYFLIIIERLKLPRSSRHYPAPFSVKPIPSPDKVHDVEERSRYLGRHKLGLYISEMLIRASGSPLLPLLPQARRHEGMISSISQPTKRHARYQA